MVKVAKPVTMNQALINLGFEHHLQQLYRQFEVGEISFEYFAGTLGLGVRELYGALEERGLPTSNIGLSTREREVLL